MKAWKRRAEARLQLGRWAEVGPDADQALALDPAQKDVLKFKVGSLKHPCRTGLPDCLLLSSDVITDRAD